MDVLAQLEQTPHKRADNAHHRLADVHAVTHCCAPATLAPDRTTGSPDDKVWFCVSHGCHRMRWDQVQHGSARKRMDLTPRLITCAPLTQVCQALRAWPHCALSLFMDDVIATTAPRTALTGAFSPPSGYRAAPPTQALAALVFLRLALYRHSCAHRLVTDSYAHPCVYCNNDILDAAHRQREHSRIKLITNALLVNPIKSMDNK